MAYCRCDSTCRVYLYASGSGYYFTVAGTARNSKPDEYVLASAEEALEELKRLQRENYGVPQYAVDRLAFDAQVAWLKKMVPAVRRWNIGAPPSIGWWPASTDRDARVVRWWSGKVWSQPTNYQASLDRAVQCATTPEDAHLQGFIRWARRPAGWPARSRT